VEIADLERDGIALFRERHSARERAAPEVDRRRSEQRLGLQQRALRCGLERGREAALRLLELDPAQPERRQRDAEPERGFGLALEQGVERRTQVCGLAVELR
jgi:hypothetical protein